jgi:hypothetical protein
MTVTINGTSGVTLGANSTVTFGDSSTLPSATFSPVYPITASAAASALTVTLNPCSLAFRSSTLTSGSTVTRTVASAISVVVPSTATLGTVSATQSRIIVLAIDNAGTVELAVVNISGGSVLDETTLISTTAIAAASNSATAYYSTTARTSVAYRVVGYVESTQATAGTWATAPSTIQGYGGQALSAMSSLGYGQTWQSVTRTSGTTYYNTTGKPITIVATATAGASTSDAWTIGGVAFGTVVPGGTTNINSAYIVPVSVAYSHTSVGTVYVWELR